MADPIHQFQINKLFTIAKVGPVEIAFTNSARYMVLAVTVICGAAVTFTYACTAEAESSLPSNA